MDQIQVMMKQHNISRATRNYGRKWVNCLYNWKK